jgi:WD40 repeat protein
MIATAQDDGLIGIFTLHRSVSEDDPKSAYQSEFTFIHKLSLKGHDDIVSCLATDQNHIYSGAWDGDIRIWKYSDIEVAFDLNCFSDDVAFHDDVDSSPEDSKNVSEIILSCVTVTAHYGHVCGIMHYGDDINLFASIGSDGFIRVWNKSYLSQGIVC